MTKEENLIEKKSAEFSQDVFEHLESGSRYGLDKFEKRLESYWRLFQDAELRLKFLRAFWSQFDALVKEHEKDCKNIECGVSSFHLELDVFLNQEIKKMSILSGEGFDPLQEENERFYFLRTAYLIAKDHNASSPYSVVISTNEIATFLDFPIPKVEKMLVELNRAGFLKTFLGAGEFLVTTLGYEYLVEFERNRQLITQASLELTPDGEPDEILFPAPLPADTCIKTFIIYSRQDKTYKEELEKHLKPLVKSKRIEVFT
ncbi:MAG: hypothetical protein EPGJADBJ_04637 [Saprospiraceae bacterium]|nr:hypothetical protein [Saprospiraceae bacterium]